MGLVWFFLKTKTDLIPDQMCHWKWHRAFNSLITEVNLLKINYEILRSVFQPSMTVSNIQLRKLILKVIKLKSLNGFFFIIYVFIFGHCAINLDFFISKYRSRKSFYKNKKEYIYIYVCVCVCVCV